ncbi:hypothetical protein K8R33_04675 [archaeon]|nr:hypothetical protein [archaeon]
MIGISNRNILDVFCIKFCKIVEKYTEYIIVSGFVVISSGRARATQDIDMIIKKMDVEKFKRLHQDLIKNDFVCVQSDDPEEIFMEYLKNNTSVRYTEKNIPLPEMEIKFAKDILDNYQIKTKTKLPLTGLDIWFSTIEMNIAFKEEYLKTPKDIEDARHLRIVYEEEIDEEEIKKIKTMIKEIKL